MSFFPVPEDNPGALVVGEISTMEMAVLRGLANGLQSKEIAVALKRSKPTVELYVRTLYAKFNAKSRAHLVALALCAGVLERRHLEVTEWGGMISVA